MSIFDGKMAFITGGSSGIGLAIGKKLAAEGAHVWIAARRPEQLEIGCQEISAARKGAGQQVGSFPLDIANREQVFQTAEQFVQQNGAPDYLINCAGITYPSLFENTPPEIFDQMMDVNFNGTVNVIKAFLPSMIQRGSGHITIISSGAGFLGTVGYSAYGASKFALRGLADVLRVELKPKGINVALVFPGDTQTPQLEYENKFKPAITKAFVGENSKVQTAEYTAGEIVKKIAKGRYIITPGGDISFYYNLTNTFGIFYPIVDMVMNQAWKKVGGANGDGSKQHQA